MPEGQMRIERIFGVMVQKWGIFHQCNVCMDLKNTGLLLEAVSYIRVENTAVLFVQLQSVIY